MALLEWSTGDVITRISANNKSVRKGTEAEIADPAIPVGEREDGSILWNSDNGFFGLPQVYVDATNDKRSNLNTLLGADETQVSIAGSTSTQVKDISFFKDSKGFSGNQLTIIARIKQTGGGTTSMDVEKDSEALPGLLTLTETSASYVVNVGTIDISGLAAGYHTLEFYLKNVSGTSGEMDLLEIWGI